MAKYPRRKLVMTQPVTLPLYGRLQRTSYSKEELMELWSELAVKFHLPIRTGEELVELRRTDDSNFLIRTKTATVRARFVCLALGRRGTPRKLGIPGEDLPQVAYSLIDAQSYRGRKILVVGGGDSAIEAALGLAEQSGNEVTLSYRKHAFYRLKAPTSSGCNKQFSPAGSLVSWKASCLLSTPASCACRFNAAAKIPSCKTSPTMTCSSWWAAFLHSNCWSACGVSFDPADRPAEAIADKQGSGLLNSLLFGLGLAVVTFVWVAQFADYYQLPLVYRPLSVWHGILRPSGSVGLACGVLATGLIAVNLAYLLRRNWIGSWLPGSLSAWMTSHVATGILALLLLLVHAAMAPKHTLGGHALLAIAVLVITGAIGRYFYAFMPRAANGRELELTELQSRIAADSAAWDRLGRGFGEELLKEIDGLVEAVRWQNGFFERLTGLLRHAAQCQTSLQATTRPGATGRSQLRPGGQAGLSSARHTRLR